MDFISIATTATLLGCSESTLRRRIADGSVSRTLEAGVNGRLMIDLNSIRAQIPSALTEEDIELFKAADKGNAEAQTDLGLLFLSKNNGKSAIYWFELAVRQDYANAMFFLGHCYLEGKITPKDEDLGLMWLSKAAVGGHLIAQGQMKAIRERVVIK